MPSAVVSETLGNRGWSGSTTRWTGSGSGVVAGVLAAAGRPRSPAADGEGAGSSSGTPLGPAAGRGAGRTLLSPLCGAGPAGRHAGPFDHQPSSGVVDGLSAPLFTELAAQLDAQGLVLKQGTLLDATLVASQVRRPAAGGGAAPSTTDPEAAAGHPLPLRLRLGVDEDTGLVRRAGVDPRQRLRERGGRRLGERG